MSLCITICGSWSTRKPNCNLLIQLQVTMAFVIDTSSSMKNDMGKVREYIKQLMLEQKKAGVDAEFIVTTFADDPGKKT